jgi:hypothetical protein
MKPPSASLIQQGLVGGTWPGAREAGQAGQSRNAKTETRANAESRIAEAGQRAAPSFARARFGFGLQISGLIRNSALGVRVFLLGARREPQPTRIKFRARGAPRPTWHLAAALLLIPSAAQAAEDARGFAMFTDYIQPLFRQHCYECHSHAGAQARGGLVLDSPSGWRTGGERGPAVLPGKPDESPLFRALVPSDADQPTPYHRVTDEDLAHLRDWISLGAPAPKSRSPISDSPSPKPHWAFQPVQRPAIPTSRLTDYALRLTSPIDAFVAAKLAQHSAAIRPEADRRTLIRRAYFDLLGLPPSPEEVTAFVTDPDPRAFERLVDRLLESPHYGERWGRHWLDVAGFAESSMFIGDLPRQGFWRYRDYVIRAFNADKPYDQFVLEQLAGDELFNWRDTENFSDEQINLLAATGFLRCTPDATDNQAITQMDKRFAAQQSAVEVSMKALTGLTINCVRCHDHKFDPITQEEYYRVSAVFQPAYDPEQWLPAIWSGGWIGSLRVIPLLPGEERRQLMQESRKWFAEHKALSEQVRRGFEREYRDRWFKRNPAELGDETARAPLLAALETPADQRDEATEKQLAATAQRLELNGAKLRDLFPEYALRHAKATNRIEELKQGTERFKDNVIWSLFDTTTSPSPARFLKRGNYETPAHEVTPGVIAVLDAPDRAARFDQPPPGDWTTGRRLELARWLTHPEHPLVARVMVNRIWQYHFGTGLVATPDDFGGRGSPPVSPELLDWLAAEFVEHGWRMKHIHRLVMGSATYRQATVASNRTRARPSSSKQIDHDDENDDEDDSSSPFAAFNPGPRRLEAGVIRDAMLEVGGRLDKRLFGPSVPTERRGDGSFDIKHGHADRLRRSVYIHTRRTYVPTFLTLFDEPQMDTNWPRRSTSAIAQQALALMNEPFVAECAQVFAARVLAEGGDTFAGRLERAFALVYQRAPSAEERALFQQGAAGSANPWPVICQALLGSSEFLYFD